MSTALDNLIPLRWGSQTATNRQLWRNQPAMLSYLALPFVPISHCILPPLTIPHFTGNAPIAVERGSPDTVSGVLTGSLSCSPPRAGTVHGLRRALAPSHCLAPDKTRRQRRRRAGGEGPGSRWMVHRVVDSLHCGL